jgi:hypothetical protein
VIFDNRELEKELRHPIVDDALFGAVPIFPYRASHRGTASAALTNLHQESTSNR